MKITPLEIKKQEFGKKFRGYSPEEVETFLEMIAGEFEESLKKNLELEEKITALEGRLSGYTKLENVLQDTLVTTQKSAEEVRASADRRAKVVIDEARVSADKMLAEAKADLLSIQRQIDDLKHQRDSFIVSFQSLLDTQHAMLEIIQKKNKDLSEFVPVRMRSDLSDADLEQVVADFEREIKSKESEGRLGGNIPLGEDN